MSPINWVARTFRSAQLQVLQQQKDGDLEPVQAHALVKMIQSPNPFYSGSALWKATLISWFVNGNAY